MKIISKITLVLAFVCTLFIINPMSVEAASGRILFNDPTIAAGEQFDIDVRVVSYEGTMDDISITLKYDSSKLEFISGSSSTGGNGSVKISAKSTGAENKYVLQFRALKKGNTSITIGSQLIKTSGGDTFTIQEGNAAVSVEGGTEVEASTSASDGDEDYLEEEVDDSVIQIAGIVYEMSDDYIESEIPAGYTQEKMEIRGENISAIKGDTSGIILVYLEAPGETVVANEYGYTPKGRFFRYDEGTGKFSPYVQITVSDTTYIVFLTEDYQVELPIQYIPTTMTADGFDFPAWQDTELDGYYLVYAISSKGIRELYRYDTNDQSYQRFEVAPEPENPNKVPNETLQVIIDTIANNLIIVLLIIGLVIFLLLVLTIIFGVKLRNRNREIDDIYEGGVTAYNNNDFNQSRNEKPVKPESEYDFKEVTFDLNEEDMLDDGLTQAFDAGLVNDVFKSEGFIDYAEPVSGASSQTDSYDDFEEFDDYKDYSQGGLQEKSKDLNIGNYGKYQASDDDDIEFIEL